MAASIAAGDTSGGGGGTPLSELRSGNGIVPATCCEGELGIDVGARGPPGGGPGIERGTAPASGGGSNEPDDECTNDGGSNDGVDPECARDGGIIGDGERRGDNETDG